MPRWLWVAIGTTSRIRSISLVVEALVEQAVRARARRPAPARRGRRSSPGPRRRSASACRARRRPRCRRGRRSPACRCRVSGAGLCLRVAGGDRDLGAQRRPGARAPSRRRGRRGPRPGTASPSTTSSIASPTISSKRDMCDARLVGVEVDEALELARRRGSRAPSWRDPDHLLDAGHADPREARPGSPAAGLDVGDGSSVSGGLASRIRHASLRERDGLPAPSCRHARLVPIIHAAGASGPAPAGTGRDELGGTDASNRWRRCRRRWTARRASAIAEIEELAGLIALGRERGYLTYEQIAADARGGGDHQASRSPSSTPTSSSTAST